MSWSQHDGVHKSCFLPSFDMNSWVFFHHTSVLKQTNAFWCSQIVLPCIKCHISFKRTNTHAMEGSHNLSDRKAIVWFSIAHCVTSTFWWPLLYYVWSAFWDVNVKFVCVHTWTSSHNWQFCLVINLWVFCLSPTVWKCYTSCYQGVPDWNTVINPIDRHI